MSNGWLKLHRKMFNNPMWEEKREFSKFEAWIDILQMVSYTNKNKMYISGQLCEWNRGQYPISISFLCDRWNWTPKKVRTYLKRAEQNKQISLFRASKWTMLTVCKYDSYQSEGQSEGKTEGNQRAIIKESKEIKEEYKPLLFQWLDYRGNIKKPLKDQTVLKLAERLQTEGLKKSTYIINLSIENGWQGLFWDKYPKEENKAGLPNMDYIKQQIALNNDTK